MQLDSDEDWKRKYPIGSRWKLQGVPVIVEITTHTLSGAGVNTTFPYVMGGKIVDGIDPENLTWTADGHYLAQDPRGNYSLETQIGGPPSLPEKGAVPVPVPEDAPGDAVRLAHTAQSAIARWAAAPTSVLEVHLADNDFAIEITMRRRK